MPADAMWLTEADVVASVDLRAAADAVRDVLRLEHSGHAHPLSKTATTWAAGNTLHALGGVADGLGLVGTKTWAHTAGGAAPLLVLWDAASGALRAVVEAFALGQLRTAAVSAVATDVLARLDATVMAMVGTGKQAMAQVAAVVSQRRIGEVRVFSPSPAHRSTFCTRLREQLGDGGGVSVIECADVASAVEPADVITTATRARDAFLRLELLGRHAHVNALGAITPERRELADSLVAAAAMVVSDSPTAALALSSELASAATIVSLAEVVASGCDRSRSGPTVFKAMGLGLADVAVGAAALHASLDRGGGHPIPAIHRSTPRLFSFTSGGHP
ncbi:MAG: ornithine cyclodeaminase family protein [Ilumatobacteraceae bacterium]